MTPPRAPAAKRRTGGGMHVALLRGVNVGGKNRLPMADLAALFADLGARDVRTYIQSGNVVFAASATALRLLPARAQRALHTRFGLDVPVVVRSGDELRRVLAQNPFAARAQEDELHVGFLAAAPTAARVAALEPDRSPGDAFVVRGRDVFLHLPNGVAKTRLTNAWFDARLQTTITVRNWRTVQQLVALATAP
jgi:uncharacterized protein (DUF1697 family)